MNYTEAIAEIEKILARLRNEEIRSILEVRDALDKLAVAEIIEHASDEEIRRLTDLKLIL